MRRQDRPLVFRSIFKRIADQALVVVGCLIYALAFNLFLRGNDIVPGGVIGVATLIYYKSGFSTVGFLIILINIPLFLIAFRKLGLQFVVASLVGTLLSSGFIDLFSFLPTIQTEPLIATLFGGVLIGFGLGLIFSRGATTGGSDIAGRLLKLRFRNMPIGALLVSVNMAVVVSVGIVFRNINAALYTTILEFAISLTMDKVIYGSSNATVAYIITCKESEVVKAIDDYIHRGSTLLSASGSFTGETRRVILCAVSRQQVAALKSIVHTLDPMAFMIVTQAKEVFGQGFSIYSDKSL